MGKTIKLLGDGNKEKSNKPILCLNNKKINDNYYIFSKIGNYILNLLFNQYLIDMSYMFFHCSSLTSLNLSNFNTNNVKDMSSIFIFLSFIYIYKKKQIKNKAIFISMNIIYNF